jgi:hypothetical protein
MKEFESLFCVDFDIVFIIIEFDPLINITFALSFNISLQGRSSQTRRDLRTEGKAEEASCKSNRTNKH